MRLNDFIETLDPAQMHFGENAPHAYFIPFEKGQNARAAREESKSARHQRQKARNGGAFGEAARAVRLADARL